jgi:hypothetical protein
VGDSISKIVASLFDKQKPEEQVIIRVEELFGGRVTQQTTQILLEKDRFIGTFSIFAFPRGYSVGLAQFTD